MNMYKLSIQINKLCKYTQVKEQTYQRYVSVSQRGKYTKVISVCMYTLYKLHKYVWVL